MRRPVLPAVLLALVLVGCGGDRPKPQAEPQPAAGAPLTGARAQAPASVTAGTLARVPDAPAARRRLAFVNLEALHAEILPLPSPALLRRVLGTSEVDGRATAVAIGEPASLFRSAAQPETSAITPNAQSAVQSCLGDTIAQTTLGPGTMGRDAALGVGLASAGDAPAGVQLRLCGAPRLVRHVHEMRRTLERRFGRSPQIAEREIGEREIVAGTVAATGVPRRELLRLLAGGHALRALAWRSRP